MLLAPGSVLRLVAITHRLAAIEQDRALEVGLFLVFLDVKPVGLRPDFPVDMANVVARSIFAVRRELDRKTVIGAAMLAGDEPFDDQAGPDIEPLDAIEGLRIEVVVRWGGG